MSDNHSRLSRRALLGSAVALGASAALPAFAQMQDGTTEMENDLSSNFRHNVSAFRSLQWQNYFDNTRRGILVDITHAPAFWSEDQSIYRLYPTSVPLSEELTRRGRTEVVEKVMNPTWRPTPSMRERNPEWPEVVEGGSPDNPLGTRALYLSWTYYRIHGTHDTRKIGRRSSNGCVGLYNEHITELFLREQRNAGAADLAQPHRQTRAVETTALCVPWDHQPARLSPAPPSAAICASSSLRQGRRYFAAAPRHGGSRR
jgi:hypothetical protein